MHPEQMAFCLTVKKKFPEFFKDTSILDIGSLDINGNNRYLFEGNYRYTGIDLAPGKNVDIVSKGHEFQSSFPYDVVMSTECFEHDKYWCKTIENAISLTRKQGLFFFTCASTGRQEHGTMRTTPQDSPFSHKLFDNYYANLDENDIRTCIHLDSVFSEYEFDTNVNTKDLYFYGIKK